MFDIAAALGARRDLAVQELPFPLLRERLLAQGQILELPDPSESPTAESAAFIPVESIPGIVLDDTKAELAGAWTRSTTFKPSIGSGYVFSGAKDARGDGKAIATFRFKVPKSGKYNLQMAYSAHETRASNVPVVITCGSREQKLTVDQTQPLPAGQFFQPIGTMELEAGLEITIRIMTADTTGFVILDALQLVPVE